ncbi:hypothetical protein GCM10009087_43770 [Sphingomonas oligophenolica]|uniref:Uncharacterized protein n=2 Tax=Sphingomonas oligophenolica TaxID=301154 RepID=A0ABU9XZQ2_9SPHN
MPVYFLHLWELAATQAEWAEIVAGGAPRVLNALPPRRRAALFGRALPFRVVVVNGDCCPVLFIQSDIVTDLAAHHGRLNDRESMP